MIRALICWYRYHSCPLWLSSLDNFSSVCVRQSLLLDVCHLPHHTCFLRCEQINVSALCGCSTGLAPRWPASPPREVWFLCSPWGSLRSPVYVQSLTDVQITNPLTYKPDKQMLEFVIILSKWIPALYKGSDHLIWYNDWRMLHELWSSLHHMSHHQHTGLNTFTVLPSYENLFRSM